MNTNNKIKFGGKMTRARFQMLRTVFAKETVNNLAKMTGLPKKYILEIESGKAHPPVLHVRELLTAMNIEAESYSMERSRFEEANSK